MLIPLRNLALLTIAVAAIGPWTPSEAAGFNISWTGANDYTMQGMFSFDGSLLNTGVIDESAVDTFMIEGFLSNVSVGTWDFFADGLVGEDTFNLNFDTDVLQFVVGGLSTGPQGQNWGTSAAGMTCEATAFGFSSGSSSQALCTSGAFNLSSSIPIASSTLLATPKGVPPIPEPTTLFLMGGGLLVGAALRRRRGRSIVS